MMINIIITHIFLTTEEFIYFLISNCSFGHMQSPIPNAPSYYREESRGYGPWVYIVLSSQMYHGHPTHIRYCPLWDGQGQPLLPPARICSIPHWGEMPLTLAL